MLEYTDPPASQFACSCYFCGYEWIEPMEADIHEETGMIYFPRPSECPVCQNPNIECEEE